MGQELGKEIEYAIPFGEKAEGQTRIYRSPLGFKKLFEPSTVRTVAEIHKLNFLQRPHMEYLGHRTCKQGGEYLPSFDWYTFAQCEKICKQLGSAIFKLDLAPELAEYKDYKLRMVSFYAKNTDRVWLLDMACSLYGITIVPIYDTLGDGAIKFVFEETNLTTCFLTVDKIKGVAEQLKKGSYNKLKTLIILDDQNLKEEAKYLEGVNWMTFSTLLKESAKDLLEYPEVKPTDIYSFSYTSGTTGDPKGVMITHENIISTVVSVNKVITPSKFVYLSYLPLAHIYEKAMALIIAYNGGKYGIFKGNVLELKEDLEILKPTIFASVPRLFNKFHDKIMDGVNKLTGLKKTIVTKAIASKLQHFRQTGSCKSTMYDAFFGQFRSILGGCCEYMVSASAPISKEVQEKFCILMSCPFLNAYGQTEGMGGEFVTAPNEKQAGIVGGPLPCLEFKLIDIPDMEYLATDKDEYGRPCPRGEVLVRGKPIFAGYYKQPEKYAEAVDNDGWLHSGDVGKILPGSNGLMIIDRRKNMFKLSQGEYVAPDRLEQSYKSVKGVEDIFVYGDSLKACLVAIINVDRKETMNFAKELNLAGSFEEVIAAEEMKKHFIKLLEGHQKKSGLKGFERISNLHIEPKLFAELDLITTTFKVKRHQAKKHFDEVITKLYVGLD